MKLSDLLEGNVLQFKPREPAPEPDINLSDIHGALGVEPAEDELQELEVYWKQALKNFKGNKMVVYQATDMFKSAWEEYQDAQDEEDFDVMDKAFDQMERATGLLK
jgi:hypothetical protein